jgi:hypothetical protein
LRLLRVRLLSGRQGCAGDGHRRRAEKPVAWQSPVSRGDCSTISLCYQQGAYRRNYTMCRNGAITRHHPLIAFVNQLHDMHSHVMYGFNVNVRNEKEGLDRCQRWLDAVLPIEKEQDVVPKVEEKLPF